MGKERHWRELDCLRHSYLLFHKGKLLLRNTLCFVKSLLLTMEMDDTKVALNHQLVETPAQSFSIPDGTIWCLPDLGSVPQIFWTM